MQNRLSLIGIVIFLFSSATAQGDVLYLRDGTAVEGTFLGGNSRALRFLGEDASVRTFAITDVESIVFSDPSEMAAESTSSPARADPYTVASGMFLVVRMLDPIDSECEPAGGYFSCHFGGAHQGGWQKSGL